MKRAWDRVDGMDRRAALGAIGGVGLGVVGIGLTSAKPALADGATAEDDTGEMGSEPQCVLDPHIDEGPFYLPLNRIRYDIREDRAGLPLRFRFRVVNAKTCQPLSNAAVDIWHCDAAGIYAGYDSLLGGPPPGLGAPGDGPPDGGIVGGVPHLEPVNEDTFLRGVQLTNRHGVADFQSIYPGWYPGRTLHIHLKVHVGGRIVEDIYTGGHTSHTSQLFFPEDVTGRVAMLEPYVDNTVLRVTNATDVLYGQLGIAPEFKLTSKRQSGARSRHGQLIASIVVGVDPDAID